MRALVVVLSLLAGAPMTGRALPPQGAPPPMRRPDVIWVPTADPVVAAMLRLARVTRGDTVYDLGCGDGKIVIAAAKTYGARGVGIDIDPQRIREANENARRAGVADQVRFVLGDIFDPAMRIDEASVVMLYLLPSLNERLRPRLLRELRPGTRVVSNSFTMGDSWPAERTEQVGNFYIYLWTIPPRGPA